MRHTLADAVVHRHKGSVRLHRVFYRARQNLRVLKERPNEIRGQIGQRLEVRFGNQQAMAGKHWAVVEESE